MSTVESAEDTGRESGNNNSSGSSSSNSSRKSLHGRSPPTNGQRRRRRRKHGSSQRPQDCPNRGSNGDDDNGSGDDGGSGRGAGSSSSVQNAMEKRGVKPRKTPREFRSSASSVAVAAVATPLPISSKTRAEQAEAENAQLDNDDGRAGHDDGDGGGSAVDCGSHTDREHVVVHDHLSNNETQSVDNTGEHPLLEKDRVRQLVAEEAGGSCTGGSGSEASAKGSSLRGGGDGGGGGSYGGGGGGDHAVKDAIGNLLLMIPVDVEKLRNMAWENGGYQSDEVRIKVWPKLLGLDRHGLEDFRLYLETPHPMAEQIQRDIDRSLTHFVHVRKWKRQRTQSKRDKLRDVINAIVRKYDGVLNYYQGYHDVVTTLLLVTGDCQLAFALTERVSHYFFRDSMRNDFAVLTYLLHLVPAIIKVFDPELSAFISKSKVEPYYCMAWVLTWFAHDLGDLHAVARLYDALLGAHPTVILYLSAAVVISARNKILECDCEFASVHNALSHAAKGVEDWEAVLQRAKSMFVKCPPRELMVQAPAYIKDTLRAGGVTSLEFPPPWFTGTSLPDWILLERRREKEGKRRITKAAKQWRRAARLAGAENPEEMLVAYTNVRSEKLQTAVGRPRSLLAKIMSRVRLRERNWKVVPSPTTLLSTAVLVGAVGYTYTVHLASRQPQWGPPP